ncbi:hypothetical protein [Azospirillum sp.]|uniref:hypothetical protein n=1 Tax=Azospirillum sp. TaxID=34012 RepID=UPI003D70C2B1
MLPLFDGFDPLPASLCKNEVGRAFDTAAAAILRQPAGTRTVYHTGNLSTDRQRSAEVCGKAAAYLEAARIGQVILTQRRVSADRYEYHAIRATMQTRGNRA